MCAGAAGTATQRLQSIGAERVAAGPFSAAGGSSARGVLLAVAVRTCSCCLLCDERSRAAVVLLSAWIKSFKDYAAAVSKAYSKAQTRSDAVAQACITNFFSAATNDAEGGDEDTSTSVQGVTGEPLNCPDGQSYIIEV